MLRLDHAGELGAIQIYRAQILVGRLLRRGCVATLEEFLTHERRHYATFSAALARIGARPCRSLLLCALGGFVLGLLTGVLGARAIMACTDAVETVVHRHLEEQLAWLAPRDAHAHAAVASIVRDEREHRDAARQALGPGRGPIERVVHRCAAAATEGVIRLGMRS
jgi:ubiquinone biosynthesis monooxygenase Coq7